MAVIKEKVEEVKTYHVEGLEHGFRSAADASQAYRAKALRELHSKFFNDNLFHDIAFAELVEKHYKEIHAIMTESYKVQFDKK